MESYQLSEGHTLPELPLNQKLMA